MLRRGASQGDGALRLSVLDQSVAVVDRPHGQSIRDTVALARFCDTLGYHRFWVSEHHNHASIAGTAPEILIAAIAGVTNRIRIGSAGVMLPHYAPLHVAEQFLVLEALAPGRIDLGLGRAPGSDQATARALRRSPSAADTFPQDVAELMTWFRPAEPGQAVRAVPGAGLDVPIWILGSSLFGAQLAAALGLPFAFASHFAPALLEQAVDIYRSRFQPSERLARPYVMLGINVFAAASDEEARRLFTSQQQAFVNLRRGRPGPLPPPVPDFEASLAPFERAMLHEMLSCTVVGDADRVRDGLRAFIERTGADELIVASQIFDHPARVRSYEITAEARRALAAREAGAAHAPGGG
ncbi:MAG TPA: LLM class flavin-dependent oxidoreductase [Gemmatimonadaceae bacterium]